MKKPILYFVIVALTLMGTTHLHAQQAFVAAGGNATGSGGNVSYSVGQVAYITVVGANASINQGVQQPYEFFTVGINTYENISLLCRVYPNPFTTHVILSVEEIPSTQLQYRLFDMAGKLLAQQRITQTETVIPLDEFPSANYLLRLVDGQQEFKTFKIIKN